MTQTIRTTQGDREPIVAQLSKYGRAVDLTGRSVTFVLRHESGDKAVDAAAEILSESDGRVQYVVTPTDIARAGSYSFEWVVTGGANDPTTLPVDEPSRLHVREDVEQDDAVFEALPEDRTVDTLFATALDGSLTGNVPVDTLAGSGLSIQSGALTAASVTTDFEGLNDVSSGTLANRPAASTAGDWYFATDGGVYYDDGAAWQAVAELQRTDAEVLNAVSGGELSGALSLGGNDLTNARNISAAYAAMVLETDGSGSGSVVIRDAAASQPLLRADEGGGVAIGGDLTDDTGTTIFDDVNSHVPLAVLESGNVTSADGTDRTIRSGTSAPADSTGENGDIFIVHD